jgi:YD repeat-containing protein
VTTLYSSNQATVTDEVGNQRLTQTDGLGRLNEVLEPNGSSTTPSMETDYTYDALNNLLSVTQWGGAKGSAGARSRNFTYDSLSRLLTATNPESGQLTYNYDANSNLLTKTDARTVTVNYSYDALSRILSKTYSNDLASTPSSCYQYDLASVTNGVGRLTNQWTQSASAGVCPAAPPATGLWTRQSILSYDSMGRILSEQQCTPSNCNGTSYAPAYTYNLAGNFATLTDGTTLSPTAGTKLQFANAFDTADRLQTVTSNWSDATHPATLFSVPTSPSYAPFGSLMNATFGSGLTLTRSYDNRLRITGETDKGTVVTSSTSASATVTITGAEQTK